MNEPVLELRRAVTLLRRRWWLIAVAGLAGATGGLLVAVAQPSVYVAQSSVLLPQAFVDASGNPSRNMQTEASIATGGEVLEQAGEAVDPPVPALELKDRVSVEAVTLDILAVRVEAEVARDAALLADAVAEGYVAVANSRVADRADTLVTALEGQASSLDQQIRRLEADIVAATARLLGADDSSAAADREAAVIDALRTEQVEAARQLSSVTSRIADARLEEELARRGTQVLQRALVPSSPTQPTPVRNALIGLVLGLGASTAWILVRGQAGGRLRYRDEIALAAGAPVVGSLDVSRRYSTPDCRRLLEHWEPDSLTKQNVRQALGRLGFTPGQAPTQLVALSLPADNPAPLLMLQLAIVAASLGIDTHLVVATKHPTGGRVRSACTGLSGVPVRENLRIDIASSAEPTRTWDLTIAVAIAEGQPFDLPAPEERTITILAVSAGHATAEAVADAALTCYDAGLPVGGVLVANPDPADRTPGGLFSMAAVVDHGERSQSLGESEPAEPPRAESEPAEPPRAESEPAEPPRAESEPAESARAQSEVGASAPSVSSIPRLPPSEVNGEHAPGVPLDGGGLPTYGTSGRALPP